MKIKVFFTEAKNKTHADKNEKDKQILHSHDIWHAAKNFGKRLAKVCVVDFVFKVLSGPS